MGTSGELAMDGSRPKSSNAVAGANAAAAADRRESEARQSFSSSSNSNLDSFFKRLGQGQGSRLWAGAGQHQRSSSGAAVPGSLRTRVRAASTRADSKANVAAGAIADGVTGGSSNSGGDGNCKTAAESRHGSCECINIHCTVVVVACAGPIAVFHCGVDSVLSFFAHGRAVEETGLRDFLEFQFQTRLILITGFIFVGYEGLQSRQLTTLSRKTDARRL